MLEIALYRTRPVTVAITGPLTAANRGEIVAWIVAGGGHAEAGPDGAPFALVVDTPEGQFSASFGDRIVRGTRGEHYPVKPAPFADRYERVEE